MRSIVLHITSFVLTVACVKYDLEDNSYHVGNVISQHTTLSRRHCSQLCLTQSRCIAANYNVNTSTCQVISSQKQLIESTGSFSLKVIGK